jgi:hypothetical protein
MRPINVHNDISSLTPKQRSRSLKSWSMSLQQIMYSLFFNENIQKQFRELVDRIVTVMPGPVRVRILDLDFGIRSWRDVPVMSMLHPPDEPYTYHMLMNASCPKLHIEIAIDGLWNSSSVLLDISDFAAKGTVVIGTDHPLARNISDHAPIDYITFSFDKVPHFDFKLSVDRNKTHFLGQRLANFSTNLHYLFEKYLAKNFTKRFMSLFIMSSVVHPLAIRVPWLTDPTDILFNSNAAQRGFQWIRRILASVQGNSGFH